MGGIEPTDCDDVFEAQYCVKAINLNGNLCVRGVFFFCRGFSLHGCTNMRGLTLVQHDIDDFIVLSQSSHCLFIIKVALL